jgi:predicted nucleic acid-binding protein
MIVIDSSTWIEYFIDSRNADIIEKILNEENNLTPSIVLIELSCKASKENWNFKEILSFIKSKSNIVGISEETLEKIGKTYIKERKKKSSFGMIDATIWSIAENLNAKILTKDNHFKDFKGIILLK